LLALENSQANQKSVAVNPVSSTPAIQPNK